MRNDPEYVAYLEQRVAALEARMGLAESRMPNTQLVSPSFFSRAFAVWGHYMVASVTIAIPFYVLMFIIFAALGTSAVSLID